MKITLQIGALGLLLITSFQSLACEICGCGNSNFQIGILPTFNKGFIGYRYSYSTFRSQVRNEPSEFSHDYYQVMELWGGYNFKKIQVMAFVPYVFSKKVSDDGTIMTDGLGDVMALVNYQIFSNKYIGKNQKTTWMQEVYLGGGIKLPSGVNKVNVSDPEFNIGDFNSQAGTGSVDYMLNATYNLLWNNSGIVTNVAYRINTANKEDFRFGNRTYLSSAYFFTLSHDEVKFKPNVGVNYQSNAINKLDGVEVEDSNGYNFNGTLGINVLKKKIGFSAVGFTPLAQNNYDGQTNLKSRFLVGVSYSI
jgi:hypothetical protein